MVNSSAVLVPISAGTGSDFVKSLGFNDLESIKSSMSSRNFIEIDLGVAENTHGKRYFVNILEVGFGASVMKRVNSRRKTRGGRSFTTSVLALLPFFRPFNVDVMISGEKRTLDLAEMVVANGRYFGGGMLAAPEAKLDDGKLDVHIVSGVGKLQMISKLGKLRNGTYVEDPSVVSYLTDNIEVTGSAPVEMDGEDFGELPVKIWVLPRSLKIVSPAIQKN